MNDERTITTEETDASCSGVFALGAARDEALAARALAAFDASIELPEDIEAHLVRVIRAARAGEPTKSPALAELSLPGKAENGKRARHLPSEGSRGRRAKAAALLVAAAAVCWCSGAGERESSRGALTTDASITDNPPSSISPAIEPPDEVAPPAQREAPPTPLAVRKGPSAPTPPAEGRGDAEGPPARTPPLAASAQDAAALLPSSDSLSPEEWIALSRRALDGRMPRRALDALSQCGRTCLLGERREEVMEIKIRALSAVGERVAASVLGEHFLAMYPESPRAAAVRGLVANMRAPREPSGLDDSPEELAFYSAPDAEGPSARVMHATRSSLRSLGPGGARWVYQTSAMDIDHIEAAHEDEEGDTFVSLVTHEGRAARHIVLRIDAEGGLMDVSLGEEADSE